MLNNTPEVIFFIGAGLSRQQNNFGLEVHHMIGE
jgi:hypothetical protein